MGLADGRQLQKSPRRATPPKGMPWSCGNLSSEMPPRAITLSSIIVDVRNCSSENWAG